MENCAAGPQSAKNLLLCHERHLNVDLRQFGDPSARDLHRGSILRSGNTAQRLPPSAIACIVVGLRKRVKLPGKIRLGTRNSRALGVLSRARAFRFQESLRIKVVAGGLGNLVAHREIAHHLRAPQVQITVFETQIFTDRISPKGKAEHPPCSKWPMRPRQLQSRRWRAWDSRFPQDAE